MDHHNHPSGSSHAPSLPRPGPPSTQHHSLSELHPALASAVPRRHAFARTASSLNRSFVASPEPENVPSTSPLGMSSISSESAPFSDLHHHTRPNLSVLSIPSPGLVAAGDSGSDRMADDDAIMSTPPPPPSIRAHPRGRRTPSASPSLSSTPFEVRRVRMKQRNRSLTGQCPSSPVMITSSPRRGVSDSHMGPPSSRRGSLSAYTRNLRISTGHDVDSCDDDAGRGSPRVVRREVFRHRNLLPKSRAFGRISAELMRESCPGLAEERGEGHVWHSKIQTGILAGPGRSVSAGALLNPSNPHLDPRSSHWGPARVSYALGSHPALPSFSQATAVAAAATDKATSFASLFGPMTEPRSVPEPPVPSGNMLSLMLNTVRNRSLIVSADGKPASPGGIGSPKTPPVMSHSDSDRLSSGDLSDENKIDIDSPIGDRTTLFLLSTPKKSARRVGYVTGKRAREDDSVRSSYKRRAISPA